MNITLTVDSIVARRDKRPYVRLFADGKQFAQLSVAAARNVALDILQHAARGEADAMIRRFFDKADFPEGAANQLMIDFREFRQELDTEPVGRIFHDPDVGGIPK